MNQINIALWSTSLTLAVIGISFGIIASINASRANQKIKNIIMVSFSSEKAHKLFFEDIKKIIYENEYSLARLDKTIKFNEYAAMAAQGRLVPIAGATLKILEASEYQELVLYYLEIKKILDKRFANIIQNFHILRTEKVISANMRKKLQTYHESVIRLTKIILHRYDSVLTNTIETSFDSL